VAERSNLSGGLDGTAHPRLAMIAATEGGEEGDCHRALATSSQARY
jgi:hypothetical protein